MIKEGKKQITSFNKNSDKTVDYISKKSDELKKDFDKLKKEGTKKVELYKKEATSKRNSFFLLYCFKIRKIFPKRSEYYCREMVWKF